MAIVWFTSGTQPFDYDRFTPQAALRAAQTVLGVTADGKYGPRTNTALQGLLNRLISADPQGAAAGVYRQALSETQGLRAGQALGLSAWGVLASVGLQQMDQARFANSVLSITGGAPVYSAGTTTTSTPAPTPTRTTSTSSTSSTTRTTTGGSNPLAGVGNASNLLASFVKNNKTALWVVGGLAVAGALGVVGYTMFSGDESDDGGDRDDPGARRALPPPAPPREEREEREERPRREYDGPGRKIALAARMLGIREDADADSIRAAYVRQAGRYPRRDEGSETKRRQLRGARDYMLRELGAG